jgi:hypothetical protein
VSNDKGKQQQPQVAVEPPRNATKAMAFLIECDESGLYTMTHCRPYGTGVAEAIKGAAKHPTSQRDSLVMCAGLISGAIARYQDGQL